MKKYLVLIGAAVLMMGLASPVLAQIPSGDAGTPLKTWGHLEIMTNYTMRPDFNTGFSRTQEGAGSVIQRDSSDTEKKHLSERYRMYFQYGDPKTVRAVIGFEADATDYGFARPTSPASVGANQMGVYQTDMVSLELMHSYLEFVVPNTPVTVTAGLFRQMIGGRMWMQNDAPGIQVAANFAPHRLMAFWWRENDRSRFTYGVNDTYGVLWEMTQQLFNIQAFAAYKNDLYSGFIDPATGVYSDTLATRYSQQPYWVALGGGFRPGNWDLSALAIYNGGKRDFVANTAALQDRDIVAYAVEGLAKYRIGPGMFAGLEGYYTTGNDNNRSDQINTYQVPTSTEGRSIFGNDRSVFFWMNAGQFGYYNMRGISAANQYGQGAMSAPPFEGMWYGRVNFEYSPLAWLRLNLNYLYIGDTSKGDPAKVATNGNINTPYGARQDKDFDYVGSELNLISTINIYKNFIYNIGIMAFFPGEMFNAPPKSVNAASSEKTADTAYGFNTNLKFVF